MVLSEGLAVTGFAYVAGVQLKAAARDSLTVSCESCGWSSHCRVDGHHIVPLDPTAVPPDWNTVTVEADDVPFQVEVRAGEPGEWTLRTDGLAALGRPELLMTTDGDMTDPAVAKATLWVMIRFGQRYAAGPADVTALAGYDGKVLYPLRPVQPHPRYYGMPDMVEVRPPDRRRPQ